MRGKSINLFLMDGEASGRIKCTLTNWTGLAYKIPRTEILCCCRDVQSLTGKVEARGAVLNDFH